MISNTSSRRAITTVLGVAIIISSLPFVSFAAQRTGSSSVETRGAAQATAFCENIDTARANVLARLTERTPDGNRRGQYETRRNERLEKLGTNRENRDQNRDTKYERLRAAADTDEKKAAVEEFIDTVESLVATRKTAVDAAIAVFEETVDGLLDEREDAVATYAETIEDEINRIFDEAEAACEDGDSAADVRTAIQSGLSTMREDIKNDREKYSYKDELEAARKTREVAVKAAMDEFKRGYEDAKAILRESFAG